MVKSSSKAALDAATCIYALDVIRDAGIDARLTKQEVVQALGVARSYVYELVPRVEAALEQMRSATAPPDRESQLEAELRHLRVRNAVLTYRLEHPGAWVEGGRTSYSNELAAFVLDLARSSGVGTLMTHAEFADACDVPLPTLKDWWAGTNRQGDLFRESTGTLTASDAASTREPQPTHASTSAATSPSPVPAGMSPDGARDFSPEMLTIIGEWERWQGNSLPAFLDHLGAHLGLHYSRKVVTDLLHLAAARKILRRPPPAPTGRGSTFRPPPGVQWTSDGKELLVNVDQKTYKVVWQPMVDVGCTATVGSVVRVTEDTTGVLESLAEGICTTGSAPVAILLDNKSCNKSEALDAALPKGTFIMNATLGRPTNKAIIEGQFGLFAQELGPVVATIDTSSPQRVAITVASAVTRAYVQGRNHRPQRADGRTPFERYRDADPSPEEVAQAVERLLAIKARIDARRAREEARRDPAVTAALEDAFSRFGFTDDGDVLSTIGRMSLAAVQQAIAIFAAKRDAGSLPPDADARYFAGIVRNAQHERELEFFEQHLFDQLERADHILTQHLERKAEAFSQQEIAPHLLAIVRELLDTRTPVAQVFWRNRLRLVVSTVPLALKTPLRRRLCETVRRAYRTTKQHRLALSGFLVHLFHADCQVVAA